MPAASSHKPAPQSLPFRERITCTIGDAIEVSGLGRRTINRRIADGSLASLTIGKRRLIRVPSLLALLGAEGDA